MSDSLTTLITKLQALLMDDGTIFATGDCTAAIRQALRDINLRAPINAGATIDAVTDQYEYELTTAIAGATPLTITDVLLEDPAGGELDTVLDFDPYIEDERWFFRLHTAQSDGDTLIVRFTQAHTINGLDSEVESTMPAMYDVVLLDDAASILCNMAAAGTIQANNVDPKVSENYATIANHFRQAFNFGIAALRAERPTHPGVPDTRSWQDRWSTGTWKWN